MRGSTIHRRSAVLFPLGVLVLLCGPLLGAARAESPEALIERLELALRQQEFQQIVLVSGPARGGVPNLSADAAVEALLERLKAGCYAAGKRPVPAEDSGRLGSLSPTSPPDLGEIRDLVEREEAEAVLLVNWKPHRAHTVVRVLVAGQRGILWAGRTTLKHPPAARQRESVETQDRVREVSRQRAKCHTSATSHSGQTNRARRQDAKNGRPTASEEKASRPTPGTPSESASLAARILDFVTSRIGRRVGNGECWTLGAEALQHAGARPPVGYRFGREVALSELQPGDVLYFHNARFETSWSWTRLGLPHHIAIVAGVQGSELSIYHQNVNGGRFVQQHVINLATLVSGRVVGYRPVP